MKSFSEYLKEVEGSKWNFDLPKTKHFESQADNIRKAQKTIEGADPELIADIKNRIEKGGDLNAGDEYKEILQALFVINHIATIKKAAADAQTVGMKFDPDDAKKMLDQFGIEPTKEPKENSPVGIGKKLVLAKRKNIPETEEKTNTEKPTVQKPTENNGTTPDDGGTPPTENQTGEEPDKNIKKDTIKPDDTNSYENNPIDKSYSSANDIIQTTVDSIKSDMGHFKKNDDRYRIKKATKYKDDFQKEADKLAKTINRQKNGYENFPTLASKNKAVGEADSALRRIKASSDSAKDSISVLKSSKGTERLAKRVGEIKGDLGATATRLGQTKLGRAAKIGATNAVSGMKKAVDSANRTGQVIKNSKTAEALGRKTTEVKDKVVSNIKTAATKADTAIAGAIEKPKETLGKIGTKINNATIDAQKTIKDIGGGVKRLGQNIGNAATGAVQGMKDGIKKSSTDRTAENIGKVKETQAEMQKKMINTKKSEWESKTPEEQAIIRKNAERKRIADKLKNQKTG